MHLSPKTIHKREGIRIGTAAQISPRALHKIKRDRNDMVYSVYKNTRKKIVKEEKIRKSRLSPW